MPIAVLNEKAKKALQQIRKSDVDEIYMKLDRLSLEIITSTTCCGVQELSGLHVNEKSRIEETTQEILNLIFTVEKGQLMMFHAPNTKHYQQVFKVLKSLGFKQICPEWKNSVHAHRKEGVISLFCYKDV